MTDKLAPFGFVQLAAWRPDSDEASFPVIIAFFSEHSIVKIGSDELFKKTDVA